MLLSHYFFRERNLFCLMRVDQMVCWHCITLLMHEKNKLTTVFSCKNEIMKERSIDTINIPINHSLSGYNHPSSSINAICNGILLILNFIKIIVGYQCYHKLHCQYQLKSQSRSLEINEPVILFSVLFCSVLFCSVLLSRFHPGGAWAGTEVSNHLYIF